MIRSLPPIRGRVRLGNFFYRLLKINDLNLFIIAKNRDNSRFQFYINSWEGRLAYFGREYESSLVDFLLDHCNDKPLLDIGANVGLITIPFVQRFVTRRPEIVKKGAMTFPLAYAVEAVELNFASLKNNIQLNGFDSLIRPHHVALGACDGAQVTIHLMEDSTQYSGTAAIFDETRMDREKYNAPRGPALDLKLKKLDTLIYAEHRIPADLGIIKMDVDGYELEILKGASRLLAEGRPVWFAEMCEYSLNWHGYGIEDVFRHVSPLGYQIWIRHPKRYVFKKWLPGDTFEMDALLIPEERVEPFNRRLENFPSPPKNVWKSPSYVRG
ncbi:MAG: FkbM family methyltransferase [Magnetococcales bacterium]|nr:FkbM family methyltransferase [Magnetococcales bacterium]